MMQRLGRMKQLFFSKLALTMLILKMAQNFNRRGGTLPAPVYSATLLKNSSLMLLTVMRVTPDGLKG